MQRYNTFNMIHKALRAMLYDTALTLQQTYFADREEAAFALEKVNEVVFAFEQHGMHEDTILMPVIEKYDPETIASFEQEHVNDRSMGEKLKHLQRIYNAARTSEERVIAGSAISKEFRDYMIFNLEHMQREEIALNDLLWNHYSDEELLIIHDRIIETIPPAEMAASARWMMEGINKEEAKRWLQGVKETAPDVVFESLFDLTENHLPQRFRKEVQEAVINHKQPLPVF
jgi:Hemerythrin HHE cation binding domain